MSLHNEKIISDIEGMRKSMIRALFALVVVFILFEALRGQHFWNKVKGEGNLWNYGSSLDYVFAGELAFLNAILVGYLHRLSGFGRRSWAWMPWAATGAAFVFLGCDEMLCIHEKAGVMLQNSFPALAKGPEGMADGLVMGVYVVASLVFSFLFMKALLPNRAARQYFASALSMVALVGLFEVVPRDLYINHLPFRETEELVELFAGWAFAAAFLTAAAAKISDILQMAQNPARSGQSPHRSASKGGVEKGA